MPGTFVVDTSQPSAIFVEPSGSHDTNGNTVSVRAALDTPVTVSFQNTVAIQVINAIFQQTGAKFQVGAGGVGLSRPFATVSVSASNEPAKYVLARVLSSAYNEPSGTPSRVTYSAFFEPQLRYYVFNILYGQTASTAPSASKFNWLSSEQLMRKMHPKPARTKGVQANRHYEENLSVFDRKLHQNRLRRPPRYRSLLCTASRFTGLP